LRKVAKLFSKVIGRTVVHRKFTRAEMKHYWDSIGSPDDYGRFMVDMEAKVSEGAEARLPSIKGKIVGKVRFIDYFKANRELWIRSKSF
jgi:hypothetical protein